MSIEEGQAPEQKLIQRPQLSDELDWNLRSKEDSLICIDAVPKPPSGYTFSNRQMLLQTTYFHKKQDKNLSNADIDLYNATIVAVCKFYIFGLSFSSIFLLVPGTCSDMFRCTIESLFITYAETNLNVIGNVLNYNPQVNYQPLNNPWLVRGDEWCQGLLRRPQPKKPLETTATT